MAADNIKAGTMAAQAPTRGGHGDRTGVGRAVRALVWALCLFAARVAPGGVELVEQSVVTRDGLHFWYPNGEKAFHYAATISPRGDCYTVADGYIFFGWYRGGMDNRDLMISRKKIGSGAWVTVRLPHKNTLIGPRNRWGESHNTITVGVSTRDNTIHILYDHHNDPLKYIVSGKNTAFVPDPEFTAAIFEPTRGYLAEGEPVRITYPKVTENGRGDLILNYRKGSAIGGNEMVHIYNGERWTSAVQVIKGADATIPDSDKNYAYAAAPVLAGGNLYYAFSVRWRRKKPDGVLNEGVYVAKCGPTMLEDWEDMTGKKHRLPIVDYSPFLVADPESYNGRGSSGAPQLAVSDKGDIAVSYRGRGRNGEYDYVYTRAAGKPTFTEHRGPIAMGSFLGDRMYSAELSRSGEIRVCSTRPGDSEWRTELELSTGVVFGGSVTKLVDGHLIVIAEDRTDPNTDRNKIHCYGFRIDAPEPKGQ